MSAIAGYPLAWPFGWPRTPDTTRQRGWQFKTSGNLITFDRARRLLQDELRMLDAVGVVLSTNLPLRQDGEPRADAHRYDLEYPGVAVYFQIGDRKMAMAQDAFDNPAANCRSLALAVEAMRALQRHGGGAMLDRAFTGFVALPPRKSCWEILGIQPGAPAEDIRTAHRRKAMQYHQRGAHETEVAELNAARDRALQGEAA